MRRCFKMENPPHFRGKDALSHVIEARKKGKLAIEETHGAPLAGHLVSFCDAAKDSALIVILLFLLSDVFSIQKLVVFPIFLVGYLIWKTGRSALLGYRRIERLHRLVEEEKWEIEHSREQEKMELKALYQAKGFSGKLLDDVIDILMADDNRLLQVMLEEEMGLSFECIVHPLKQANGAFFGVLISSFLLISTLYFLPHIFTLLVGGIIISVSACFEAKKERNKAFNALIWNVGLAVLSALCTYYLSEILKHVLK